MNHAFPGGAPALDVLGALRSRRDASRLETFAEPADLDDAMRMCGNRVNASIFRARHKPAAPAPAGRS